MPQRQKNEKKEEKSTTDSRIKLNRNTKAEKQPIDRYTNIEQTAFSLYCPGVCEIESHEMISLAGECQ